LNNDPITIRKIKLKNLVEFARNAIDDPAFEDVAPISLLRAKSQFHNPQADPDDMALLVALHQNRCVGYHGLLPGLLKNKHRVSKLYWLVTFYLAAEFRGQGYGKRLVTEIKNTNVDLVTTGITTAAAGVYRSEGFRQLGELPYCQLRPENGAVLTTALQHLKSRANAFTAKPVNQLSQKFAPPAARQGSNIAFQRDIQTINWMIRNPWVISRQDARPDVKQYYFSRVRDQFEFVALEIFAPDGKARKGYLVLSISRNKDKSIVKVLDFYFHDAKNIFIAGLLAIKYARDYQADRLEYPAELAGFLENQPDLIPMIKMKKRLYLFYPQHNCSPLSTVANKIKLNYCDSDTAFT
jgi:GNAT superfamily N-acetyltransferase